MKKFLACAAAAILAVGCNNNGNPSDPSQINIEFTTTDLVVGTGAQVASGNAATVNYTLWLYNPAGVESKGNKVQSSTDPGGEPLLVVLGNSTIIPGFQQALLGMRVGGKRRAYIPASLAFGSSGTRDGSVPPNASVVFEIELLTLVQ